MTQKNNEPLEVEVIDSSFNSLAPKVTFEPPEDICLKPIDAKTLKKSLTRIKNHVNKFDSIDWNKDIATVFLGMFVPFLFTAITLRTNVSNEDFYIYCIATGISFTGFIICSFNAYFSLKRKKQVGQQISDEIDEIIPDIKKK